MKIKARISMEKRFITKKTIFQHYESENEEDTCEVLCAERVLYSCKTLNDGRKDGDRTEVFEKRVCKRMRDLN